MPNEIFTKKNRSTTYSEHQWLPLSCFGSKRRCPVFLKSCLIPEIYFTPRLAFEREWNRALLWLTWAICHTIVMIDSRDKTICHTIVIQRGASFLRMLNLNLNILEICKWQGCESIFWICQPHFWILALFLNVMKICKSWIIFLFPQLLQDRNGVRKPFLQRVGHNIQVSTCLEKSYEDRYWVILTHVSTMKIVDNGSIIELFSQSPFSQLSFSESSFNNFKCSSLFSTSS